MTFNQSIHEISDEIAELVISKQRDYGVSNILNCPVGAEIGILVRLHDKMARLSNLIKAGKTPKNESIEDTWKDIVGYSLIALMVRKGTFEAPLDENND
jgi:hypothetical protein